MARAQKKVDMAPLKSGFKVPDIQLRMDQTYNRKPMIKGEGVEFDLTEEQELEYIKCAASCTYFLKNYYKITSLDEGFILFRPYLYQEELIEAFQNHRFNISLQSRQSGKCVDHDTMINIRHKVTGEIKNISIGDFHHMKEEREPIYYGNQSGINLVQLERRESYSDGLASTVNRKFVRSYKVTDWDVLSDTGYVPIKSTHITTKYDMWYMKTANGKELICADDHIVFKAGNDIQKFVKNLKPGMRVMTDDGVSEVIQVINLGNQKHMYDLQVDSENHRYFTDGILSHNTTVVAAFILWFVTFHASKEVVVVANKEKQAKEILARISAAYQDMPAFMQAGAVKYGSTEIEFDNKSKISAYATSPDAARGKSLSLLYVDEAAFVDCDYDFWDSVSPTVAQSKKSKIIMTSTPNGQRGLFYDLWKGAEPDENGVTNGFNLTKVTWRSVPLYAETEGWEAEKRRQLGDAKFDQEYDCLWGQSNIILQSTCGIMFKTNLEEAFKLMSDNKFVVYKHTCVENGKSYVGITKRGMETRWKQHVRHAARGSLYPFHCAISKYGEQAFTHEILFVSDNQDYAELQEMEQHFIKYYNTKRIGYNLTDGGEGTLGFKFSKESRRLMKESAAKRDKSTYKGPEHTEEQKRKWSALRQGVSTQHNKKLSDLDVRQIIIDCHVHKVPMKGVGTKSANGRLNTYVSLFSKYYGELYGVNPNAVRQIITGKTRKPVWQKYPELQNIDPNRLSRV
ncbi:terminase large subunit [Vibrio phage VP-1]|uniref:Terminase large subunit n=1 Tax=Vibrio phage VP-1 TaxID=2234088 RepID=A0A4P2THA0_9CAUD|nr:terminase large subunit [Vibrio phage VP-1]